MLQAERFSSVGPGQILPSVPVRRKRKATTMVTDWEYYGYTSVKGESGAENPMRVHLWKCPNCGCVTTSDATKPDIPCPVCEKDVKDEIDQRRRTDR